MGPSRFSSTAGDNSDETCVFVCGCACCAAASPGVRAAAAAQDPELLARDACSSRVDSTTEAALIYPTSGLEGNRSAFPAVGVSVGLSSIAEIQIDGGFYNHLSITSRQAGPALRHGHGDRRFDLGVFEGHRHRHEIRIAGETESRPSFGLRFATKLPNASNESGLGLDTTDFFASVLVAKDDAEGPSRRQRLGILEYLDAAISRTMC